MNNFDVEVFEEIRTLCLMALDAIETADRVLMGSRSAPPDNLANWTHEQLREYFDEGRKISVTVFRNVHSFISCCANISKLVWIDPRDRNSLRRHCGVDEPILVEIERKLEEIRLTLDLANNNTFHWKNRGIRNALAHYNVRLFALMAETGNMSSFRICTSDKIDDRALGTTAKSCMRTLVVDTGEYIFQGEAYNLDQMKQDVRTLLKLVLEKHPMLFVSW